MPALLDVNALITLVDSDHVAHIAMSAYAGGRRPPAEVIDVLNGLKAAFATLGLAAHHSGTVVSFDRSLAFHAVRDGSERLNYVRNKPAIA